MPEPIDHLLSLAALDPDSPAAQSRITRLALAYMTADQLMSTDVFLELNTDPRGHVVALNETVIALSSALIHSWTRTVTPEDLIPVLRATLAALDADGVSHD
jgi:hypothetical protein